MVRSAVDNAPHPNPGFTRRFTNLMILFYGIIPILALPEYTGLGEYPLLLKSLKGGWLSVLVYSDQTGCERMWGLQHLTEEALSRIRIACGTQHEVQRGTRGIEGAVEVIPALFDLDVGLIHVV